MAGFAQKLEDRKEVKKNKLYILNVSLSGFNKLWRQIAIPGDLTLEQLHKIIFIAFDRYDPHLYSFYLTSSDDKSRRRFATAEEYTDPLGIEEMRGFSDKIIHDASKTALADLNLSERSSFEYLFDYGDEWLHTITVEKVVDIFPQENYPLITKRQGASPPQYPDFDEDGFDEVELGEMEVKNNMLLDAFKSYLEAKNLSEKTVKKHTSNATFYINVFLQYEEPLEAAEGIDRIDYYLGYWFIRKAMWASVTAIKENITSLKHFYTFMLHQGKIEQNSFDEMKQIIKLNKSDWIKALQQYDDPDVDFEDFW